MPNHAPPLAKHIDPAQLEPHETDPKKRGALIQSAEHGDTIEFEAKEDLPKGTMIFVTVTKKGNRIKLRNDAPLTVGIKHSRHRRRAAS